MNKKKALPLVVVGKKGEDIVYSRYEGKQSMETIICDGSMPLQAVHVEALRTDPHKFCKDNGLVLEPNEGNTAA